MPPILLAPLLLACSAETGFSSQSRDAVASSGDAVALVEPASLSFDEAQVDVLYAQELSVSSLGADTLLIYSLQIIDDYTESFEIGNGEGDETVSVEPEDSYSFLVHLTLAEAKTATASLILQTNDPDQLTIEVPLTARPADGDTGAQ